MKCTCDKEVCDVSELCPECRAEYQAWCDEVNELHEQAMFEMETLSDENEKTH